ncbi:PREDICTED: histone deacetylase HDT1-like isoform X2 [Camelina sativa]|uniref:Histone deacetylase HDT1-like isoform X2 n=1 Tax=Camelina sativa TaxID=90675 RepID=A0ABM0TG36_CAMSA|nr:PREDICTED: histone deacetylase HDT1-like isoform X2 [Camelina sativa]
MEFWGIEVKPGKPVKVTPERHTLIHVSQASLGECKNKKEEFVSVHVKVGDQKLVMGNLSTENIPQLFCDLVFEKEFELSHNWGKGSLYFVGYTSPNIADNDGEDFSDSEEEEEEVEEVPATITANGNPKPKAKPAQVKKNAKPADGMVVDEDSEEEEETPTPKKPVSSKKRANEEAPKTPVSSKKAKVAVTPQKTDEKKKGGKNPATQSPKSASQVSCGSCKKTFNSGNALESHNKAKHAAAK